MHPDPLRVLVVYRDPDVTESFVVLLGLWGHDVRTATDLPTAVAAARDFPPDVVLLDLDRPGRCACPVRELRAWLGGAFLVGLSGYCGPADRGRHSAAGFDHFLPKPPDLGELKAMLRRVAGGEVGRAGPARR